MAQKLIKQTKANYNILASHFSYTRGTIWPELKEFSKQVTPGSKVLDLGCGNGRVFAVLKEKNIDYLGFDFSEKLVSEAKKRHPQAKFKVADITQKQTWQGLENKFDFIFCIAVFHHLPTKELQQELVKNIKKALKHNGHLYITVWNLWQPKYLKYHFSLQSLKLKWRLKNLKALYVPYKLSPSRKRRQPCTRRGVRVNRFVHAFTLKELKKLFEENEFFSEEAFSSGKNLCLVAKKKN